MSPWGAKIHLWKWSLLPSSFPLIHISKFPSLRSAKSFHVYIIQGFCTEWVRLHWRYSRVFFVFCTYLSNMYLLQYRKPNHRKRNAMYNVNPATTKILVKMRKRKEVWEEGERKGNIFKKEMEAILWRSSQTLAFHLQWWMFFII